MLGPDGRVYGVPFNAPDVLVMDTYRRVVWSPARDAAFPKAERALVRCLLLCEKRLAGLEIDILLSRILPLALPACVIPR